MTSLTGSFGNCIRLTGAAGTGPLLSSSDPGSRTKDSIQVYRGDSLKLRMEIVDEFGESVDLTDAEIRFSMKCEQYCQEYVYSLNTETGGEEIKILNTEEGLFDIYIPYTETENWTVGWPLWYDVEITWPEAGIRKTVKRARIEVLQDITNL